MKRSVDVAVSGLSLLLALPLMIVVAILTKLLAPGPVLYGAPRVGHHGRPFTMWKFRTMIVGADKLGASSTADDDKRLTPLGRTMRRFKFDEIPQLWNVLIGEMSLVGPRPQVVWAVARYTEQERILLTVRPGITDPASLSFANEGEILRGHPDPDKAYFELIHPEKMRLSIDYVKNRTFLCDIKILFATLAAPLRRRPTVPSIPHQDTSTP